MKLTLIARIAVPMPTFGEYIEKMKDLRDAELYPLDPQERIINCISTTIWPGSHKRQLGCLLVINPGNPTGQFIPLDEMVEFLHRARRSWSW